MSDLELAVLVWVAVALVAGIVEVADPHVGSMFAGLGAAGAAITALLGYGLSYQAAVFLIVAAISLVLLRRRLAGHIGGRGVPSRTAPLIGRQGVVTHDLDPVQGTGRVTVNGEDWAARSTEALVTGTTIRVVGADGIVLEVTRV